MKIHADKILSDPPHALRVAEVKRIFAALPPEWTADCAEVRLSNLLDGAPGAFFDTYGKELIIYSRARSKEKCLRAILLELSAAYMGYNRRYRHARSKSDLAKLDALIEPYLKLILPQIARKKKELGYHPSIAFREVGPGELAPWAEPSSSTR